MPPGTLLHLLGLYCTTRETLLHHPGDVKMQLCLLGRCCTSWDAAAPPGTLLRLPGDAAAPPGRRCCTYRETLLHHPGDTETLLRLLGDGGTIKRMNWSKCLIKRLHEVLLHPAGPQSIRPPFHPAHQQLSSASRPPPPRHYEAHYDAH